MGKFWFKTVILLSMVVVGLNFLDNIIMEPSIFERKMERLKDQEPIEIAIFGSSHAHSTYDPRVIEANLRLNAYNFGNHAQRLEMTKLVANEVVQSKNIRLAIVDIFKNSFLGYSDPETLGLNLETIDNIPFSLGKMQTLSSEIAIHDLPSVIWPALRNHQTWKELDRFHFNRKIYLFHGQENVSGFQSDNTCFSDKVLNSFLKKYKGRNIKRKIKDLTLNEVEKIEQVISVFEAKDIPILFVNAPSYIYDYDSSHRNYSRAIEKYVEKRGYEMLDFNIIKDKLGLNREHYRDPNHLNGKGAYLTTKYLASYIKENYDLQFEGAVLNNPAANRYLHFENNLKDMLFLNKIKDEQLGIEQIGMYQIEDDLYEIVMETTSDTISDLRVKLNYKIEEGEEAFLATNSLNKIGNDIRYFDRLTTCRRYSYNGRNYYVFPFQYSLPSFHDLRFYIGEKLDNEILTIKNDIMY